MSNSSGSSVSFKVKSTTDVSLEELPPPAKGLAPPTEELPPGVANSVSPVALTAEELPPGFVPFVSPVALTAAEELPPGVVHSVALTAVEELPPGVVHFVSPVVLTAEKVFTLPCWFLFPRPKECTALRTNPARNSHKQGG
jgi:hypothetical protein